MGQAEIKNLEKYRSDLERLIDNGQRLEMAMLAQYAPNSLDKLLREALKEDEKISEFIKNLPLFKKAYQSWYSESLILIKQLLPDRLVDFTKLYERPKSARKDITFENYVIEDALQGLQRKNQLYDTKIVAPEDAIPKFTQQLSILLAVEKRFESSLFDIKQLVQADLFDSELDAAIELNSKGYVRAGGAIAGVVLEKHLAQVCGNHKLSVNKKRPTINDLAQALKENDVLDMPAWRNIQYLADLRNLCDHDRKNEPKPSEIEQLVLGVAKVIKTLY